MLKLTAEEGSPEADIVIYMCKELRKVFYRRSVLPGYEPGLNEEQRKAILEDTKVREGYLHCWTEEVDSSGGIAVAKSVALVEDAADGRIYPVEYQLLAFKEGVL